MKKFVFVLSLILVSFAGAFAQSSQLQPLQSDQGIHAAGLDTTLNTASKTQVIRLAGYIDQLTFQAGITKLTGTVGGSVKLYGSIDNLKWDYATTSTDTLAVANVSSLQVKTWKISPSAFQYYKAVYQPTGTQTSTISTNVLWRKK